MNTEKATKTSHWKRVQGTGPKPREVERSAQITETLASQHFKDCCRVGGVSACRRQASKFSRHYGAAWLARLKVPK